jgi:hypothetical protein
MSCRKGNHWFKIIDGVLQCQFCGELPDDEMADEIHILGRAS